jgi:ABC-type nitrate/sulfonate/bicarbonate transport system permease component
MTARPATPDVSQQGMLPPAEMALHGDVAAKRGDWRALLQNKWVLRALFYGAILIAWQVTAMIKGEFFLPTVPATVKAFGELFTEGYANSLLTSVRQLLLGFIIALAIAIPLGALMGRSKIANDMLAPYVNTLFVTPKQTLLPILIIAFGIGFWYRAWVVILFAVFFPTINTAAGVHYVDKQLRETARAFATSRWRMLTRIYLPAAAPFIVAGIRLGFGMAVKGMVIAELWILADTGNLLETFSRSPMRLDLYYALVLLIIGFSVVVNELLKAAERKLRPAAHMAGQI